MLLDDLRIRPRAARSLLGRWRDSHGAAAEPHLSSQLAGRVAAGIFVVVGVASLASLVRPNAPGEHTVVVLLIGLAAAIGGLVAWRLPWNRWPREATLMLVPVGLTAIALRNIFGGDDPYLYSVFFVVVFTWIGIAHRQGTSLKMLPLFVVAYVLPLLQRPQDGALAAGSVVYVGVVCVLVAEVLALVSAKWQRAHAALRRAHTAVDEICGQLAEERDATRVWQLAAQWLCRLLGVPNCDIYQFQENEDLVCVASVLDGEPYPEYLGKQADLSVWAVDRESIRTREPVLISSPDDPRLSEADRAVMLAWNERAALIVPLLAGSQVIGLVEIGETRSAHTITREQTALAQSICHLIALSIRDSRVIEEKRLHAQKLSSLLRSCNAVAGAARVEDVLATVVRAAVEVLDVTSGIAYEYEPELDTIVGRAMWETAPSGWSKLGEPLPLAEHPFERDLLAAGDPAVENLSDPFLDPVSRVTMEQWGEKCCLTIPIRSANEPLGLLSLWDSARERRFTDDEFALATSLAELAGESMRNTRLMRDLRKREEALRSLHEAGSALARSALDHEAVLKTIAVQAMRVLDCARCSIFEYDAETDTLAVRIGSAEEYVNHVPTGGRFPLHEYPAARRLLDSTGPLRQSISDPYTDPACRADMLQRGEKTCLSLPLRVHDQPLGFIVLGETERERVFAPLELQVAQELALQAAVAINNARSHANLHQLHFANLRALGAALHAKDRYTQGHASRVAAYMVLLGRELGWPPEYLERVEEASLLHDVGKLGVSDRILLKQGPLNEDEWYLMRQHPAMSAEILRPLLSEEFVLAVRHHHERYDGGGYPDGLVGTQIPRLARAFAVADSYDAMSRRRAYRRFLTAEQCRDELVRCSGGQFDPMMVAAFLRVLDELNRHRDMACAVAAQAGAAIDADDVAMLVEPSDEARPEYQRVAAALRRVRDAHAAFRYVTVVREKGDGYEYVADPEESESLRSRIGERLELEDELPYGYTDDRLHAMVLDADRYGVWISGFAPIRDSEGRVVALVVADVPAEEMSSKSSHRPLEHAYSSLLNETAQRISKVEIEAITDGLTGLYNHRHFHERLSAEVAQARDRKANIGLLFIDIDHFKVVNDTLGHRVGDRTLRDVARVIEGCTRRADTVARYGGEEFVVLLTDSSAADSRRTAERIRTAIREEVEPGGRPPVTVSIGLAQLPDDATTKEELLEKAEREMYQAKQRGRDRVVTFAEASGSCGDSDVTVLPLAGRTRGRSRRRVASR